VPIKIWQLCMRRSSVKLRKAHDTSPRGLYVSVLSIVGLIVIGIAVLFISLPDVTELKGCLTTEMYHIHLCDKDLTWTPYNQNQPLHRWRSHYVGRRFILLPPRR